ncbi:unnamed protein product [Rhizophagus irregularis]|nr:unnamed protein product [Rhizophagus irregularis]CAB5363865.1 unnamed protein product [Rhizophagus irregularis]
MHSFYLHPDSKINHKSKPRIPRELLPTSAATIDDERKPISRHNETSSLWNHAPPKSSRDNALPKGPREALISSKNKANYAPPKGSWSNKPGNEPISSWDKEPSTSWDKEPSTSWDKEPSTSWDKEPSTSWDKEPTSSWDNEPTRSWDNEPTSSWGLWGNAPTSPWAVSKRNKKHKIKAIPKK